MFSDAVLAILITLLGLDLRPPMVGPGHLVAGLLEDWPVYLAYTISFVNLAVVWLGNRTSFARLRALDVPLTWANLGVLFCAALVPFATSVVAKFLKEGNESDVQTAIGLYSLIGALLMASWLLFDHCLVRNPGLVEEGGLWFFRRERRKALLGVAFFPVGGLLGFVSPWIALTIFLGIPIFYGVTAPRD